MPIYSYKHPDTGVVENVYHSIDELSEPSESTLEKITLPDGRVMKRVMTGGINVRGAFMKKPVHEQKEILKKKAREADLQDGTAEKATMKDHQIDSEMKEIAAQIKSENNTKT